MQHNGVAIPSARADAGSEVREAAAPAAESELYFAVAINFARRLEHYVRQLVVVPQKALDFPLRARRAFAVAVQEDLAREAILILLGLDDEVRLAVSREQEVRRHAP